jgi:hypothetical protein
MSLALESNPLAQTSKTRRYTRAIIPTATSNGTYPIISRELSPLALGLIEHGTNKSFRNAVGIEDI